MPLSKPGMCWLRIDQSANRNLLNGTLGILKTSVSAVIKLHQANKPRSQELIFYDNDEVSLPSHSAFFEQFLSSLVIIFVVYVEE